MAYIDYNWYVSTFGGSVIPQTEFDYLASAATRLINVLVTKEITSVDNDIKEATAYESETLFAQGGIDALCGMAVVTSGIDEKLGDYSIGTPYVSNEKRCYSVGGIPINGITLGILKKKGLMGRCAI